MRRGLTIGLGIVSLLFAVLSARLGIPALAYGVVGIVVVAVVLCVWDRLDGKILPILVFLLGLSFLYQTTLLTNNLIGTDIHTEYFIYQKSLAGGWDMAYPHSYNTAIGSTLIAPTLTRWFGFPGFWIYKAVFPFLFAFVPALLFYIYRREFSDKIAFVACVLFVTLPTYILEMIGLPRQMLGELMLAMVMFLIIIRPMRRRYLIPSLLVVVILGYLFHYVMGPLILMMLVGSTMVMLGIRLLGRWVSFPSIRFPLKWMALAIILPGIIGFSYYANVAGGTVADNLWSVVSKTSYSTLKVLIPDLESETGPEYPAITETVILPDETNNYFEKQEPVIRTALGLDFADASPVGKGFRIFQFGIQLSIVVGSIWLVFKRRTVSAEYIGFAVASIILLAALVLLPRFSNIINATRFYHIALFALSPLLVMGSIALFRNLKVAVVVLIIPYLLFSTGFIFEAFGETDIGRINLPYSIALSNYRIGIVGEYTEHDVAVANWIVDNGLEPVLTDIGGMLLLSQDKDPFEYINRSSRTGRYYRINPFGKADAEGVGISELKKGWGYLPQDVDELSGEVYIFLTELSMKRGVVSFKPNWYAMTDSASGMRVHYPFSFIGLEIADYDIVYQSGDAVILRMGDK